jgi:hypothetical protein
MKYLNGITKLNVIISDKNCIKFLFRKLKKKYLKYRRINNIRRCHCVFCEVKIDGAYVCGKGYTRGEYSESKTGVCVHTRDKLIRANHVLCNSGTCR